MYLVPSKAEDDSVKLRRFAKRVYDVLILDGSKMAPLREPSEPAFENWAVLIALY
jgi:hypothetical protein